MCRALKPGGRWILHTANAESPFYGRVRYGDITHEQAFTQSRSTSSSPLPALHRCAASKIVRPCMAWRARCGA